MSTACCTLTFTSAGSSTSGSWLCHEQGLLSRRTHPAPVELNHAPNETRFSRAHEETLPADLAEEVDVVSRGEPHLTDEVGPAWEEGGRLGEVWGGRGEGWRGEGAFEWVSDGIFVRLEPGEDTF